MAVRFEWVWVGRSGGPDLTTDDRAVARLSLAMADSIAGGGAYHPEPVTLTPYPPLGIWTGAVGSLLDPAGPITGMLHAQSFFVGLLVLCTWAALRTSIGWPVALAAAMAGPIYGVWSTLRGQAFLELQQGACLALVVAAYVASEGLRRPAGAALLGVALGLGLLTKFSFVLFVGLPAVVVLAVAAAGVTANRAAALGVGVLTAAAGGVVIAGGLGWVAPGLAAAGPGLALLAAAGAARRWPSGETRTLLIGAGLVVAGAALVAGPWYLGHLDALRSFLGANLRQEFDGEVFPVARIWWTFPAFLGRIVLDDAALCLFVVGALRVTFSSRHPGGRLALGIVLAGLVLLTLQPYRTPRYAAPLAAPALMVAAHGLFLPRFARPVLAALIFVWCARVEAATLGGQPDRPDCWSKHLSLPPNNEGALTQLRDQALSPTFHVHTRLQPPRKAPMAFGPVASAIMEGSAARTIRSIATVTEGREIHCERLALAVVAEGANPTLVCSDSQHADVVVGWKGGSRPRPGLTTVGDGDLSGLRVWVDPRFLAAD